MERGGPMVAETDNLALVRDTLERMLSSGDIRPLLDRLADDVAFAVAGSHDAGKAAVADYFVTLGDLVTFWSARYSRDDGACVVVRVEESFIVQPSGLEARSELRLLFELHSGLITRFVIEESPAWAGDDGRRTLQELAQHTP
jgi:hypothetical protein